MTQVTANGNTYSDNGESALDMRNGGHRQWLLPMLGDVMHDTGTVNASAAAASASAAAAANSAAAILATSTSSLLIETGSKTFTTQTGKQFAAGQWVTATSAANSANQMYGQVTSYSGSTLIVNVTVIYGSGTLADWNLSISGVQASSVAGVASLTRSARTSNTILGTADKGALIDITSGTFTQTFVAAATLGNGWWCYVRNSGTGAITITTDGYTYPMWPGECRLIQCDGSTLRSIVINAFKKTWLTYDASPVVPPGYTALGYRLASGSGGGGSGRRGPSGGVAWGGTGGGGAGYYEGVFTGLTSGGSFVVTIGAAGTGGAARTTDDTNGLNGGNGGASSLIGAGLNVTVTGGIGGLPGNTTGPSGAAGGGIAGPFRTAGTNLVANGSGDLGGGYGMGNSGSNGILLGSLGSLFGGGGGGGGCGYNGGVPTATAAFGASTYGNAGGAGGAAATAGSTGGSTADKAGGGGGGGGASVNGTNSGAGGDGVAGFATIWGII